MFQSHELPNNPFHPADFRYWLKNTSILHVAVEYVSEGTVEELGYAPYIGEPVIPVIPEIPELRQAWDLKIINKDNLNELL